ncbi:Glyoxalase/bleomycin resistance protein/dioxygenase [Cellulomonas flavigena DSM 20109]|uniref:Glyoxalase/bleomycin resistance protein/dioxygenase n=1 Tax=Cellulomonas flavigena (strain ATCC 482 / DSM 20109 / BCRC 11376 / JCM 18109 / NBRC 3775 / NCIMB 8073 / NRS 134) TaxID=446466 RepID=D5ULX8_CELFN|nr:VOC family protein [Cellulomonas flavigena]ADG76084.1 Glyoxalase/bleomycin resistance protein/dioxygenase [Cellulomonas flavigena DSM 20109]
MTTPTSTGTDGRVLHADTSMDAVTLHVGDLEGMSSYYADAIALEPLEERSRGRQVHRVLGRGTTPMLRLVHTPDLPGVDPRQAGLFHTAFLFDDAASLSATVLRAAQDRRGRFVGSSDHLVSEAFYFTDPEGNGIELYTDRDRDLWLHRGGELVMATEYLDPNAYLREHLSQAAVDAGPALPGRVGHVHLQVGDIPTAAEFYLDTLGFEATVRGYPGALFASAGGYHHHVAMNTWNSAGAGPRASTLGLGDVAVTVPGRDDLDALATRLRVRRLQFADDGRSVSLRDPWGTQVTVSVPGTTTEDLLLR